MDCKKILHAFIEELDYDDIEEPQKNCSVAEIIKGGEVSYSNEGLEGSVLTYHCKIGYYAYPVSTRVCNPRGDWSVMILPNGKTVSTATCKGKLLNMSYCLNCFNHFSHNCFNLFRHSLPSTASAG